MTSRCPHHKVAHGAKGISSRIQGISDVLRVLAAGTMRVLFVLLGLIALPALAAPPKATDKPVAGKDAGAKALKDAKAKDAKGKDLKGTKGKDPKDAKGKDPKASWKRGRNGKNAKLCDFQSPIHTHQIVPGENVGEIAGRYGVLITDIKRWNKNVKNINRIRDGQTLQICPLIPPRERLREEYTVQKGDSFASIAKHYDLSQDELWNFQQGKLEDRAKLAAGKTTLIIWHDGDIVGAFQPENEKGKLAAGVKLRPMKAYYMKRPDRTYGTRSTVQKIQQIFERFQKKQKGVTVVMGDLSARGGGALSGHVSHQDGRDVDIGWVFKKGKGNDRNFTRGTEDNLDVPRTWALVHEFLKTGAVQFIFIDHNVQELLYEEAKKRKVPADQLSQWFQYPRPAHRLYGIVRHWPAHNDHMHVRFRKGG